MPRDPASGSRRTPTPLDWLTAQLAERPEEAGLWYGKGVLLAKEGETAEALRCFDKVLWLDPQHHKALEAKSRALFRTERFLEAFELFRKLTERVPRDEEYWYHAGECLLRIGRADKAVSLYERALEINPNYTDAWYGRGNALKEAGLAREKEEPADEQAPAETEAATDANPELEAKLQEAERAYVAQEYEEALRLYDGALILEGEAIRAWEGKGKVLTRLARFSEAAEAYEHCLTGRSPDAETWLRRGQALRESGELGEALESYDMALRLNPLNPMAQVEREEVRADLEARRTPVLPEVNLGFLQEGSLPPVATHIGILDDALRGGFSPGSVVLVTGMPGTFKTSLCLWVLYQQALHEGTKGFYVTLEQSKESLLRHAASLGLELARVADDLRILDLAAYRREFVPRGSPWEWLTFLEGKLREARDAGVELLALDSLAALRALVGLRDRRELFRLFDLLRSLEVTTFLVDERLEVAVEGRVLRGYDPADYLADGIVEMTAREQEDGEVRLGLRVAKVRDRAHPLGLYYVFWDGEIRLTPALAGPRP